MSCGCNGQTYIVNKSYGRKDKSFKVFIKLLFAVLVVFLIIFALFYTLNTEENYKKEDTGVQKTKKFKKDFTLKSSTIVSNLLPQRGKDQQETTITNNENKLEITTKRLLKNESKFHKKIKENINVDIKIQFNETAEKIISTDKPSRKTPNVIIIPQLNTITTEQQDNYEKGEFTLPLGEDDDIDANSKNNNEYNEDYDRENDNANTKNITGNVEIDTKSIINNKNKIGVVEINTESTTDTTSLVEIDTKSVINNENKLDVIEKNTEFISENNNTVDVVNISTECTESSIDNNHITSIEEINTDSTTDDKNLTCIVEVNTSRIENTILSMENLKVTDIGSVAKVNTESAIGTGTEEINTDSATDDKNITGVVEENISIIKNTTLSVENLEILDITSITEVNTESATDNKHITSIVEINTSRIENTTLGMENLKVADTKSVAEVNTESAIDNKRITSNEESNIISKTQSNKIGIEKKVNPTQKTPLSFEANIKPILEVTNSKVKVSKRASRKVCDTPSCKKVSADIIQKIDFAIDPCEDFYQFSCGNFKEHKIKYHTQFLIEYLYKNNGNFEDEELKIFKKFFNSCVKYNNEGSFNKIKQVLSINTRSSSNLTTLLAFLIKRQSSPLFEVRTNNDNEIEILPPKDSYDTDVLENWSLRSHIRRQCILASSSNFENYLNLEDIFKGYKQCENNTLHKMAKNLHLFKKREDIVKSVLESASPEQQLLDDIMQKQVSEIAIDQALYEKTCQKVNIAELNQKYPHIDWKEFFNLISKDTFKDSTPICPF